MQVTADYSSAPPPPSYDVTGAPPPVVFGTAATTVTIVQAPITVQKPASYLGWSIFNTIACFLPLGVVAILYSLKVASATSEIEARRCSKMAKVLNICNNVLTPILIIIIIVSYVIGTATRVVVENGGQAPGRFGLG